MMEESPGKEFGAEVIMDVPVEGPRKSTVRCCVE